jgi:uncharacterized protein YeaO (DUF488 family)
MNVRLRRAYDDPRPDDGVRVLVDRVWPRGRTKEELNLERWARDIAPSTELRRWFGHDPARWDEFRRRYQAELRERSQAAILSELVELARAGTLTIVFGARDTEHSQARVIADEIEERLGR